MSRLPRWSGSRALALLLALPLGLMLPMPLAADAGDDLLPLQVKAAFLYNFVKFTTWPDSKFATATAPLVICVLEPDPFGDILDRTIEGKRYNGRPLLLRRSTRAADLRGCHLVYLGSSEPEALASQIRALAGNSILLVSDAPEPLPSGGIRFLSVDRRIRFQIDVASVERESLKLSSKLLSLSSAGNP